MATTRRGRGGGAHGVQAPHSVVLQKKVERQLAAGAIRFTGENGRGGGCGCGHLHQLFLGHMDRYYDWLAGREMTEDSMRQLLTDTDNFIWAHRRRGYESVFAEELKLLHAMLAAKLREFGDYFGRFLFTCRDMVEELGPEPEVELGNNWLKGSDQSYGFEDYHRLIEWLGVKLLGRYKIIGGYW
ncbi:hypothetical protein TYRP_022208 [Tyrophagus putrescentiae]|nr:hypothetical protein TYRP_022208 [Tyrophagus putrescentiae]